MIWACATLKIFRGSPQGWRGHHPKDHDLVSLVERNGAPPHVIWVTCGNTTNARLKQIPTFLRKGEPVVEIER